MFRPGPGSVVAVGAVGVLVLSTSASASSAQDDPDAATSGPNVLISEAANGGPGGASDDFIEIANFGDETAELEGWAVFRCITGGGRNPNPQSVSEIGTPDGRLPDITLEPGETFLFAHEGSTIADLADVTFPGGLVDSGFGVWLEDDQRQVVDVVAIYPHDRSQCGPRLPNDIDYRSGLSWQRMDATGDVTVDYIKAARTPGEPNATEPDPGVQPSDVLISELANGGPAGNADEFAELANFGEQAVDVSGWRVYSCNTNGRRYSGFLQATLPGGTVIEPGGTFVAAHPSVDVPDGIDHVRNGASLIDTGFGIMVEDSDGNVMDSVGVYETDHVYERPTDSPCSQGTALPNRLDYGFDETYQRFQNTSDNSADFVKAPRTIGELVIHDPDDFPEPDPVELGPVRISELTHSGPGGHIDTFLELANYGDEPVSLDRWTIDHCRADGRRVIQPLIESVEDVTLEPGETFLAVREDSPLHQAGQYDAVYTANLSGQSEGSGLLDVGYGLIVYDADGDVVDRVYVNTHATAPTVYSPCINGASQANTVDTEAGDTYQRLTATGSEVRDFVRAPRTPGELPTDLRAPWDFTEDELAPVDVEPNPRPLPSSLVGPNQGAGNVDTDAELAVTAHHTTGEETEVTFRGAQRVVIAEQATRAFIGVSDDGPPAQRRPRGERPVQGALPFDGTGDPVVAEATEGFPYQRYQLVLDQIDGGEIEVVWSGRSTGSNELQLYAWNHHDGAWELLGAGGGVHGDEITLVGTADVDSMVRGRMLEVLVQDGPGTHAPFSDEDDEPNLAFKDPAEYDFSFGFMSDTQYLAQGHHKSYAEMNRWLVTNQDARNIAYTFHTGDIIQKYNQAQIEGRARGEFEAASQIMRILDDAGHPNGVIPGNHDNVDGESNDLYNEYFGPDRYEGQPWFGAAWAPDDNLNHYDVMEIDGAKFLMVYLGYFGGYDNDPDEALDWANQVIADHPDHNVIVATHAYLLPDGSLSDDNSRWNHLAHRYWQDVILPNENVFLVLSGHHPGVALNVKRDVGGVEGRTVIEMLADYSGFDSELGAVGDSFWHRNTGFLRLLQIDVDSKTMAVNTYSPSLDEYNAWQYDLAQRYDQSDDEFTIFDIGINDIYDKRVETDLIGVFSPAEDIDTVDASAGEDATVTWRGLAPGTTYGWYAEARDANGAVARSPVWTFTTSD